MRLAIFEMSFRVYKALYGYTEYKMLTDAEVEADANSVSAATADVIDKYK